MMRLDGMNRTALSRCLALLIALSAAGADTRQEAVKTTPEPAPQQPPANNWFKVTTPGKSALARPESFLQYGPSPAGACCPGRRHGHFCRQLLAWATYYPQFRNRICSIRQCCNSCQFKGVAPLYMTFLNPKCMEGSPLHATVANQCYRGCKDCAGCGHP